MSGKSNSLTTYGRDYVPHCQTPEWFMRKFQPDDRELHDRIEKALSMATLGASTSQRACPMSLRERLLNQFDNSVHQGIVPFAPRRTSDS